MLSLYEIDQNILDLIDFETGEIKDYEAFKSLNIEREKKLENIACFIKNLKAENEALKNEIDNLSKRKKINENKISNLSNLLQNSLNNKNFKTSKCSVSFRKTSKCVLDKNFASWAAENNRDDLLVYQEPKVSLNAVKIALENGEKLPAKIEEYLSMGVR